MNGAAVSGTFDQVVAHYSSLDAIWWFTTAEFKECFDRRVTEQATRSPHR